MKTNWGELFAIALLSVSFSVQAATWDGEAGDGYWTNAVNWSGNTVPGADETIDIANGDVVDVDGVDTLPGGLTINLTGGSDITGTTGAFRLSGSVWNVGAGSDLGGTNFWDLDNATMTFEEGSSATMVDWEQRADNSFTFNLGAAGFTAITPDTLRLAGGTTMADATYIADLQNYAGSTGSVVLVDFAQNAAGVTASSFLDSTRTVLNPGAFTNSTITFDDVNFDIILQILDAPPPVIPPITWDNGSGDGSWTTAANWDPDGVPAAADNVLVGSGGVVTNGQNGFGILNIESGASVSFSQNLLPGNMITNAGIVDVDGVWRLQGGAVDLTGSGSFGINMNFLDTSDGTLNFDDGASFANTNMAFEIKATPAFGFKLSETGFSAVQAGALYNGVYGPTTTWENVTFDIDAAEYDISNGKTLVLMDFTNVVWIGDDQVFDPVVNIEGGAGTLTFDEVEHQIVLSLYDGVIWDNGGSGQSFETPENWVGDVAPVSTNTSVLFDSSISGADCYLNSEFTIGAGQAMLCDGSIIVRFGSGASLTVETGGAVDFKTDGSGAFAESGNNAVSFTYKSGAMVKVNQIFDQSSWTHTFVADGFGVTTVDVSGLSLSDSTLEVDVSNYNAWNGTDLVLFDYQSLSGAFSNIIVTGGSGTIDYAYDIGGGDLGIALIVPPSTATTAQGTPYAWLAGYYDDLVTVSDFEIRDLEDTDVDSFASWQEYIAGTDPTHPASLLTMIDIQEVAADQYTLRWQGVSGKTYTLLSKSSLNLPWSEVQTGIAGVEPVTQVTTAVGTSTSFFRVEVE